MFHSRQSGEKRTHSNRLRRLVDTVKTPASVVGKAGIAALAYLKYTKLLETAEENKKSTGRDIKELLDRINDLEQSNKKHEGTTARINKILHYTTNRSAVDYDGYRGPVLQLVERRIKKRKSD